MQLSLSYVEWGFSLLKPKISWPKKSRKEGRGRNGGTMDGLKVFRSEASCSNSNSSSYLLPLLKILECQLPHLWNGAGDKNCLDLGRWPLGSHMRYYIQASAQSGMPKVLLFTVFCVESGLKPRHPDSQPSMLAKNSHFHGSLSPTPFFLHLKICSPISTSQVPFEKCLTSNADITSRFSVSLYLQSLL